MHDSFGMKNHTRNFLKSPIDTSDTFTPRGRISATNDIENMEVDTLNSSLNKYQRRTRRNNSNTSCESDKDIDKNNSNKK